MVFYVVAGEALPRSAMRGTQPLTLEQDQTPSRCDDGEDLRGSAGEPRPCVPMTSSRQVCGWGGGGG